MNNAHIIEIKSLNIKLHLFSIPFGSHFDHYFIFHFLSFFFLSFLFFYGSFLLFCLPVQCFYLCVYLCKSVCVSVCACMIISININMNINVELESLHYMILKSIILQKHKSSYFNPTIFSHFIIFIFIISREFTF